MSDYTQDLISRLRGKESVDPETLAEVLEAVHRATKSLSELSLTLKDEKSPSELISLLIERDLELALRLAFSEELPDDFIPHPLSEVDKQQAKSRLTRSPDPGITLYRVGNPPLKVGDRVRIHLPTFEEEELGELDYGNPDGLAGTITGRYAEGSPLQSGEFYEFAVSVDSEAPYVYYPDLYHAHELEKIND